MTTLESPLWAQNLSYPSYSDRTLLTTLMTPGIPEALAPDTTVPTKGDLKVTVTATTPPTVSVAPGTVVIPGNDQLNQGNYLCRSTAATAIILDAAPPSGSRIDLIYARVIDTSSGATGTDGWHIDKTTGTADPTTPVAPAVPSSAIALAHVTVTAAGAITVTDKRVKAYSGLAVPFDPKVPKGLIASATTGAVSTCRATYVKMWAGIQGARIEQGRKYLVTWYFQLSFMTVNTTSSLMDIRTWGTSEWRRTLVTGPQSIANDRDKESGAELLLGGVNPAFSGPSLPVNIELWGSANPGEGRNYANSLNIFDMGR